MYPISKQSNLKTIKTIETLKLNGVLHRWMASGLRHWRVVEIPQKMTSCRILLKKVRLRDLNLSMSRATFRSGNSTSAKSSIRPSTKSSEVGDLREPEDADYVQPEEVDNVDDSEVALRSNLAELVLSR